MADDISLDVAETNKLREKLGLPPLKMSAPKPLPVEVKPAAPSRPTEPAPPSKFQLQLLRTKGLGEEDEEDDLLNWVNKSRQIEQRRRADEDRKRAKEELERLRKRRRQEAGLEEEDEGNGEAAQYSARDLAGLKVKHNADEIEAGETVILTLADKPILNAQGELNEDDDDELEHTVAVVDKKRKAARTAAAKPKSLADYDDIGKGGHLDESKAAEGDGGFVLGRGGRVAESQEQRQEAIRAKLQEKAAALLSDRAAPSSDYMTAEEEQRAAEAKEGAKMGKKDRKRKLRQRTAAVLDEIEPEEEGGGDLGSRMTREERQRRMEAQEAADQAKRSSAFNRALDKANYASLALRVAASADAAASLTVGGEDEDEGGAGPDLVQRIGRATGGMGGGVEEVAKMVLERREASQPASAAGSLVFSGATEFIRGIDAANASGGPKVDIYAGEEAEEEKKAAGGRATLAPPPPGGPPSAAAAAAAAAAGAAPSLTEDMEMTEDIPVAAASAPRAAKEEEEEKPAAAAPKPPGPTRMGMGSVLGLLRDTGELTKKAEWTGRSNDKKLTAHNEEAHKAMFTGQDEDELGRRVEAALQKQDQFGRVMTPKEAFRQLNYVFHGKAPSKIRQEKTLKKYAQELQMKKKLTSANAQTSVSKQTEVQAKLQTPYLVLQGNLNAGQVADPKSAYATLERMGKDKGQEGGASGSMAPPPPRAAGGAGAGGAAGGAGGARQKPTLAGPALPSGNGSKFPGK